MSVLCRLQYTGDSSWEERYNAHVDPIDHDIKAVQVGGIEGQPDRAQASARTTAGSETPERHHDMHQIRGAS